LKDRKRRKGRQKDTRKETADTGNKLKNRDRRSEIEV
jgi:hypothetical protein